MIYKCVGTGFCSFLAFYFSLFCFVLEKEEYVIKAVFVLLIKNVFDKPLFVLNTYHYFAK